MSNDERGLFRKLATIIFAIEKEYNLLDERLRLRLHRKGFSKANLASLLKIAQTIRTMDVASESVWFEDETTRDINQMSLF